MLRRADSELSKVFSCSNDLILSSSTLIRAAAYDKINMTLNSNLFVMNNISQNVIPSYKRHTTKIHCLHQWYTQNSHTTPVVYANSHATARCLHQWYAQNSHATTRCLHQWYTQKQSRNNMLPSPVVYANSHAAARCLTSGVYKTVTQQHVAFTGGTRKNSHATITYCLHRRYEQDSAVTTSRLHQRNTQ